MQGEPLTELPTSLEDSVQTNLDELTERIISARMQNNSSMEDDAERDYRFAFALISSKQWVARPCNSCAEDKVCSSATARCTYERCCGLASASCAA